MLPTSLGWFDGDGQEAILYRSRKLLEIGSGSGSSDNETTTNDGVSDDPMTTNSDGTLASSATNGVTPRRKLPPSKPSTPPSTSDKGTSNKLVKILSGTLIATIVVILAFIVLVIVLIFAVVKINRRRKLERELVLRTKQDIFEGVPNGITSDEMSFSHKYNVDCTTLDSPTRGSDDGEGKPREEGITSSTRETESDRT